MRAAAGTWLRGATARCAAAAAGTSAAQAMTAPSRGSFTSGSFVATRRDAVAREVPVPGRHPFARARIAQWLVLDPAAIEARRPAPREERLAVAAHEVRHRATAQREAVQPQPSLERVHHTVAQQPKLAPRHVSCRRPGPPPSRP